MTEAQVKEQIEAINKTTEKALQSREAARIFLDDPKIFPPKDNSSKKKK